MNNIDLAKANLTGANLVGVMYSSTTKFPEEIDKTKMTKVI